MFCSRRCRQIVFRLRRRRATLERAGSPLRFAYFDPPYPGKAWMYRGHPDFAGEVDFAALIAGASAPGVYDGWALSTSMRSLRWVLPLCPEGARVCPWVKPHGAAPRTYGMHNCWEPLIVVGGRQLPPGVRDWLSALPARSGGDLPGRKPLAFCAWLFDCLGMVQGDTLDDRFPGSGIVGRAWRELSSLEQRREASPLPARRFLSSIGDGSPGTRGDGSPVDRRHVAEGPGDET